jgi:enoyl-CoA hydratase
MPQILYTKSGGVARITLNRPEKLNALTPEMFCRLADAWDDVAADDSVTVALLQAAGDRAFCSGGDLGRLVPLMTRARPAEDEWDERLLTDKLIVNRALLRNVPLYKPVVAAINGLALAGGTEILMSTDIRVASSSATFGLTEVRSGLIPAGGSLVHLPRQVSWPMAMEIVLVAEPMTAEQARQIGFVNRVVPPDEVAAVAEDFVGKLAKASPLALRKAKEAMVRSSGRPLEDGFSIENEVVKVVLRSSDAKEGPRAFMESRQPRFTGH